MDETPELIFSDLQEGRTFRTLEYHVTDELVREYTETIGDRHPFYCDEVKAKTGPFGSKIAPHGLAGIYGRLSYLQDHIMPSGGILAKQEFEFKRPIRIGETLRVKAKVIESHLDKKNRKRVTFIIEAENQNAEPVSSIRINAIWPK
jgi:3-hydroxybutyryl-CoA dehydratase